MLGELLHGYFENYASDESLPPDHWFWDRAKSGGIFIEHGVHFFDLFAGWLGRGHGRRGAGGAAARAPAIEDQVQCTVRYGDGVLVNFYHGFTQPGRMDRQELRLVFERGDVTLYDWVPTRRPDPCRRRRGADARRCATCSPARGWTSPPPTAPRTAPAGAGTRTSTSTR